MTKPTKQYLQLVEQEDVKALFVHEKAIEAIGRMHDQVALIGRTFGENSQEYRDAAVSLMHCLWSLFRFGWGDQSYVTKERGDDGLSLFVQAGPSFVYGIIWFRNRRDDGTSLAGIAGTWSTHS